MTFKVKTPFLVGQEIGSSSTTQLHPLGMVVYGDSVTLGGGEFIYLKGLDTTVRGSVVTYDADGGATALLAANAIGPVAVAMGACVTGEFGWYQIQGKAIVKAGTVADNGNVYATATGGTVDDAVVAGDRVKNAKFASADGTPSAGLAECEIQRPFMDDAVAA